MTNADKIRQMNDRQLARFLWIWKINSVAAFLANGGYGSMNARDIGDWVEQTDDTFVCTETYVGEDYIFDQDFNTKADRKTENCSEKQNNCEDWQDWKDRMWAEAIVTEPTISKMEQVETSHRLVLLTADHMIAVIASITSVRQTSHRRKGSAMRNRCCCNCRRNVRIKDGDGYIRCNCEIDGHYIGYIECFEGWCRHWAKDKLQEERSEG